MDKINELRHKIDQIDQEIMSLLDQRFTIAKEIGRVKRQENKVVLDQNRENIILELTSNFSHSPQIKEIYITIMNESKALQRK
jgi:chorismate mutase